MEAFGSTLQATVTKYDTEESEAEKGSDLLNIAHTMDMLAMKEKEKQDGRLVNAEARAHGGISQSVWLDYFRAGGEESLSGGISNRRSGLSCLAEKLSETHPLMKRCN